MRSDFALNDVTFLGVYLILGNGQKREYPVLFWPKTDVPENNSGRECLKKNQTAPGPSEHPPIIVGRI